MTTALDQDRSSTSLRSDGTAANDDHLGHAIALNHARHTQASQQTSATGGWDAYDVWRRLIKDARDRRAGESLPQ